MGMIICKRCGRETNTALCDWMEPPFRCYATWNKEHQVYQERCGIDDEDADLFKVSFAKKQIKELK